jgi:CelD/BcsL family acetyltransferase involved in cellulose biosynthesis
MTEAPEVLTGAAAVQAFDEGWDSAATQSAGATIFQSAPWYRAWSTVVAPAEGATPLVIRICCNSALRAGLALQISEQRLAPLGSPWSDYHEAVVSNGDVHAVDALASALGRVLTERHLTFHGEDIRAGGAFECVLRRLGGRVFPSSQIVEINLTDGPHVERLLNGNEHRVKRRRLERRAMVRIW